MLVVMGMEEDPSTVKPLDVVEEPLLDLEQVLLADGELGDGNLLVFQPQLHHEDDDDGTVFSIPEMKSIIDNNKMQAAN